MVLQNTNRIINDRNYWPHRSHNPMTLSRIHGRVDWWNCHHSVTGRHYSVFGNSVTNVIAKMFEELSKDGIYLVSQPSLFY